MSHSSKCSGGHDILLDLFSLRVPVMCDVKTRSYQYSIFLLTVILFVLTSTSTLLEVLANAKRQHWLPLIFLFASCPEQHISLAFSTGVLPRMTTPIALDESYLPDEDIRLFFTDKFQEIKSTHRLRAYIPLPNVLKQLIEKSLGQFIYTSTVMNYVSSTWHKPMERLDIVLGIRPQPQNNLPFAELDALYTHILAGMEELEHILEILSIIFFWTHGIPKGWSSPVIEEFLSLQPGDIELYLGDLNSLVNIGPTQIIHIIHASLIDFLMDPTCLKEFWINPRIRHTAIAHRCLQLLLLCKSKWDHSLPQSPLPDFLKRKCPNATILVQTQCSQHHLPTWKCRDDTWTMWWLVQFFI